MTHRTLIANTPHQVGSQVTIQGWAQSKRDHGKVTFIDVRDRTGVIQTVAVGQMREITTESVVEISGTIKKRPDKLINDKIPTGQIELEVQSYQILNLAKDLPVSIDTDGSEISEEVRLKYRYLDLRRERLQKNLQLRSDYVHALRLALQEQHFTEVETPILTKSTKEGARDFIVPSRFQPGKFYALPQSPQQYKQLLMTAGVEKYFQFARCIRDEDLRADRGFEHTQLDLELSFVDREQVMSTVENLVVSAVKSVGGKLQSEPFPVISYQDAMAKYGEDRFDLRSEAEKSAGVLAFAWVVNFPFFKRVDTTDAAEVQDGKSGWTFTHNPFSQPLPEHLENHIAGENIDQIMTTQYDLVCNGYEVGGGSIRAHDPEVLRATFKIMGYSDEEIEESVGHMLKAFSVGTPPHGGIALGLDRHIMVLAQETSLKECIAFPMSSSGRTAVMDAPSPVADSQLAELSIDVRSNKLSPHEAIVQLLHDQAISYQYITHEPVFTSQEAAAITGESLGQGAKSLVVEIDKKLAIVVVPGDKQADLDQLKVMKQARKVVLVSKDTVLAKTKVAAGAVPPFGSIFGWPTFVDPDLLKQNQIFFNPGRHDRTIGVSSQDYIKLEHPQIIE